MRKFKEIHLITATGRSAFICESIDRALVRWTELGKPYDWRIVEVETTRTDITPRQMNKVTLPRLKVVA